MIKYVIFKNKINGWTIGYDMSTCPRMYVARKGNMHQASFDLEILKEMCE